MKLNWNSIFPFEKEEVNPKEVHVVLNYFYSALTLKSGTES